MSRIPIHLGDGLVIGIGDSNRDGKLDFDFGLRADSWGSGPFGGGHVGGEIGFNTQRGLYLGGDSSFHNGWGSSGSGARIFTDGGHESHQWSNDIFGNYHNGHQASGPGWISNGSRGGNIWTGQYHGHETDANLFATQHSNWNGNMWTGRHHENHMYADIFGRGGAISVGTPPFVPNYGGMHYMASGAGAAGHFFGFC